MTNKLKFIAAVIGLILSTMSCTKDVNIKQPEVAKDVSSKLGLKDIKVEDNYFTFVDINHFLNSMRELNAKKPEAQMEWYAQQKVETMQSIYNKMLKSYELLADETDINKVNSFRNKYSDIAIFEKDGTVSIDAPIQYAQIVNRDGLVKIDKTLIACNLQKSIQILDGDKSKIQEGLRMLPKESNRNIIILDEIGNKLLVRGTCAGAPLTPITISDISTSIREFPNSGSTNLKYRADTKLIINNWQYGSNRFAALFATTKSYKRGLFGAWYSTSVTKRCSGTIVFSTDATCAQFDILTGQCIVSVSPATIPGYSETVTGQSETSFPIIGPYSYYTNYAGALQFGATFAQSCSDLTVHNFFQNNTITQQVQ
jgi:hypothetical protein